MKLTSLIRKWEKLAQAETENGKMFSESFSNSDHLAAQVCFGESSAYRECARQLRKQLKEEKKRKEIGITDRRGSRADCPKNPAVWGPNGCFTKMRNADRWARGTSQGLDFHIQTYILSLWTRLPNSSTMP